MTPALQGMAFAAAAGATAVGIIPAEAAGEGASVGGGVASGGPPRAGAISTGCRGLVDPQTGVVKGGGPVSVSAGDA